MGDYCVRLIRLPYSVHGFTAIDEDGFYSVYINDALNDVERGRTFRHELKHIMDGHFYSTAPVEALEREARNAEKGTL